MRETITFPRHFLLLILLWETVRDAVSTDNRTVMVWHLSSRKNLLIVGIVPADFDIPLMICGIPDTDNQES